MRFYALAIKKKYGFKKGSATVHALHDLTENIFSSLDEKQFCMGIFIDLRRAFNIVDEENKFWLKNWNFMLYVVRLVIF